MATNELWLWHDLVRTHEYLKSVECDVVVSPVEYGEWLCDCIDVLFDGVLAQLISTCPQRRALPIAVPLI